MKVHYRGVISGEDWGFTVVKESVIPFLPVPGTAISGPDSLPSPFVVTGTLWSDQEQILFVELRQMNLPGFDREKLKQDFIEGGWSGE